MPEGSTQGRQRPFVTPPGYAISQFAGSAAMVGGLGLAPDGLLLFAAAAIGSVIDTRRVKALNPWLFPSRPGAGDRAIARAFAVVGVIELAMMLGLAVLAYVLVRADGQQIQAVGPALVAGVVSLVLGYWLRRKLDARPAPGAGADRPDDDDDRPSDDGPRAA